MMKFCALNESSLSEDDGDPELATREAQEEEAYSLYHSALRLQNEGKVEESEEMFKEILGMEFLEQVKPPDDDDEEEKEEETQKKMRPALTLKYLLYKNLANIANNKEDFTTAVNFFLDALEIDGTDVLMWYQLGKLALKISNYSLARLSFEEGLKCNPSHWPCLDNVITVMHCLNDYANCLYYIAKGLERECYYLKGLVFKDEIYREDPSLKSFCESYFQQCDPSIHQSEYDKEEAKKMIQESLDMRAKKQSFYKPTVLPVLSLSYPIKENTWKSLGESLNGMYDSISRANPCVSYSCKIDLSPYGNKNTDGSSDKSVTSLPEQCNSNSNLQGGLIELSAQPSEDSHQNIPDPGQVDMEVDESAPLNLAPYSLTLPPIDILDLQTPDQSSLNDSLQGNKRMSKRKRLLTELSEFATKRRSSRVRNPAFKKPQDNTNYQELLQKFLPPKLIGDGKCDDMDEDSDLRSLDKNSSDMSRTASENDKSERSSANSNELISTEKEDVCQFLLKNQSNSGIIDLLYNYLVFLGRKSTLIWPRSLIDVFCSAFYRFRKHIATPNLFSESVEGCRIKEVGLAILAFCEFKIDKWYQSTGHSMSFSPKTGTNPSMFQNGAEGIGNDFHADMEFLVMFTARRDILEDDWLDYTARALWLKAKYHSLEGEIDLAISCMAKLNEVMSEEENTKILVQNSNFSNVITSGKVQQQLESLERCQSLEEVQRLYEQEDYTAVVDLLILAFNQPQTKRRQPLEGVPERHAQLLLLQNSLWKLERYQECVHWSEASFNEALQQFMNAARSDWSETMAQLLKVLDNCVKLDSNYLNKLDESKLVRLTQNLILVIVIQMENHDFSADNASLLVVLPWLILHRLILNEEKQSNVKKMTKNGAVESGSAGNSRSSKLSDVCFLGDMDPSSSMPSSLMLLFTAHEYLGRHSWCTSANGHLLHQSIDIMQKELQDPAGNLYLYKEYLETGLEQCIYCLYGHPNKRSRAKHLAEHNTKQMILTWERAYVIYQYFKPNILPEFDSYRTSTVSAELETLLKRITTLVPTDEDPTSKVDNYTAYIEGVTEKCPEPPFLNKVLSPMVKDLYYLLADYYFKNKEFSKAIRYYLMDICLNPDRQDSWAGMALSRSSQLDQKLNSYELRNESTIYRKSSAALKCFEHALELDPTTISLWIEHGSLAYILHSHASRQLKQDNVCEELGNLLRKKKMEMLRVAERCFRSANRCDDGGGEPEEAWLHHYMLGKIGEKRGEKPSFYLPHYEKALMYLHEDCARYPTKILYHNPAELSIEVLEVYYRVHASCLKYLWKHESQGTDLATLKNIKQTLRAIAASPFVHFQEKSKRDSSCPSSIHSEENSRQGPSPAIIEPRARIAQISKVTDHNYFEDSQNRLLELSERRGSRPSIDSSPENSDVMEIKELLDSLVGVVTEKYIDELVVEEVTKEKLLVETIAEESVYTTAEVPEVVSGLSEVLEVPNASKILGVVPGVSEDPSLSVVLEVTDDCVVSGVSEVSQQQMELDREAETAASMLVQEMKSEENAERVEDMDYSIDEQAAEVDDRKCLQKPEENDQPSNSAEKSPKQCSDREGEAKNSPQEPSSSVDEENKNEQLPSSSVAESNDIPQPSSDTVQEEMKEILDDVIDQVAKDSVGQNSNLDASKELLEQVSSTIEVVNESIEKVCLSVGESKMSNGGVRTAPDSSTQNEVNKNASTSNESVAETEPPGNVSESNKTDKSNSEGVLEKANSSQADKDSEKAKKERRDERRRKKKAAAAAAKAISPEELKISRAEIAALIPVCLDSMRQCLQRFVQHYKALYRMAHYYCYSTRNKNLQWAREILLAATPATRNYPAMAGLFAERKNANFFNGIWRAPSNEIDRPGSFGAHMYRSVILLIQVLTEQRDYNMLVYLTQQLYRTPDLGKKYMRDTDRVFLVRSAFDKCVRLLRSQMKSLLEEEPPPEESRLICCLLEIYRACQALLKAGVFADETNDLLEEAYTMYRMGEVDSHPSVLEQATKFCHLQLGKSYSQNPYEMGKSSFKYAMDFETGMPMYPSDPWQKGKRGRL